MPQPYENGSRFMRKPAMDGKFPTAVLLRSNLARGRPFSRLSFAAMRLFDENLFQINRPALFLSSLDAVSRQAGRFHRQGKSGLPS